MFALLLGALAAVTITATVAPKVMIAIPVAFVTASVVGIFAIAGVMGGYLLLEILGFISTLVQKKPIFSA